MQSDPTANHNNSIDTSNGQVKHVWLDCDPGHDDMLAIILACLSPDRIHLLGISTSAGNSTIQNTTQNTLNILHEIQC